MKNSKLKIQNSKLNLGFTFVEAILYIAIITILFTALIPFGINIIQAGAKSSIQQNVQSEGRFVLEKIVYEVRNARDIDIALSNFGTNFATNPTHKLSIDYAAPDDPTEISVAGGIVQLTKGSTTLPLNSSSLQITNLTFTNNTSADLKTKHLSIILSVSSGINTRQEYIYSTNFQTGVELRSN